MNDDWLQQYEREMQDWMELNKTTKKFGLTPQELEIVSVVVKGTSGKKMTEYLKISEDTLKHHLSNIFDKLGVSTRLELALFAVNQGLPLNEGPPAALENWQGRLASVQWLETLYKLQDPRNSAT